MDGLPLGGLWLDSIAPASPGKAASGLIRPEACAREGKTTPDRRFGVSGHGFAAFGTAKRFVCDAGDGLMPAGHNAREA
jgi:hypothetical protein